MSARSPKTYDEITRRTVIEPDSSFRPIAPSRPDVPDDQTLLDRVRDALLALGLDEVGLEVEDGRISLIGWVRDHATSARVEKVVRRVEPNAPIVNHLHVRA